MPRPFWTPSNALGFVLALAGLALLVWARLAGDVTARDLALVVGLVGGGMWFVDAPTAGGFFAAARETAAEIRGARVVQAAPGQSVTVDRPAAPTAVVPPEGPPTEVRAADAPADAAPVVALRRPRGGRAGRTPPARPPDLAAPLPPTDDAEFTARVVAALRHADVPPHPPES